MIVQAMSKISSKSMMVMMLLRIMKFFTLLFLFQMNLSRMTHTPPALAMFFVGVNRVDDIDEYIFLKSGAAS